MVERYIKNQLIGNLKPANVTCLFGARRTGKTFLMQQIKDEILADKVLMVNGEDLDTAQILSSMRTQVLRNFTSGYTHLFIDEAQKIKDIGANLKLLVDTIPEVTVFITGSASFDLRNKIGEPLTGRSRFFNLYPFSFSELGEDFLGAKQSLHEKLIFGTYPRVHLADSTIEKRHVLDSIRNGYLLKDVLELDNLKDSLFIFKLLKLVAFQIGNTVSYNELSNSLQTTVKTVKRYLEILEKTYILFSLPGYSRNLRKEFTKTPRYFFWDNGIRNAIVSNFNMLENRDDVGRLWENYCIAERMKRQHYLQTFSNFYFWRTYDQQEIDLIEETDGRLTAFEFKWGDREARIPKAFEKSYPDAIFTTINTMSFYDFISI